MPTYEYACGSCGHHLEVSQSFSDEPMTTCPMCGGPLRKVFGSIGIVLKGSGFYRTDSRSGSSPKKKDKKDKDREPASSGSGGSGDAGSSGGAAASSSTSTSSGEGSSSTAAASA